MRETASKSALLLGPCLRWAHPKSRWFEDRPENAQAREDGKDIHKALHLAGEGLPYNVATELQAKTKQAVEYLAQLKARSQWLLQEVAFGINWKTGDVVGPLPAKDRDYPDDDTYFYGTADIVALLVGGSLLIADWKTGRGSGVEEQLLSLACAAARKFPAEAGGFRPIRIAPLYITEDQGILSGEREVGHGELAAHQDGMANAIFTARSEGKPRLPVIGSHCTELYCPHLAYCPRTEEDAATAVHAAQVCKADDGTFFWTADVGGDVDAGRKAMRLAAIKRAVKFHEGKVKDWVNAGGKAVWDGYIYEDRGAGFRRYRNIG